MAIQKEIERKFLVKGDFKSCALRSVVIRQGFLCTGSERVVRVRTAGDKAFITLKGKSDRQGLSRFEWEKEIDYAEALELLKLCKPSIIEKERYIIPAGEDLYFEVDVFHGANEGLVIAEIELPAADTEFEKMDFLGEEVTGDKRYYNSYLSQHPYAQW